MDRQLGLLAVRVEALILVEIVEVGALECCRAFADGQEERDRAEFMPREAAVRDTEMRKHWKCRQVISDKVADRPEYCVALLSRTKWLTLLKSQKQFRNLVAGRLFELAHCDRSELKTVLGGSRELIPGLASQLADTLDIDVPRQAELIPKKPQIAVRRCFPSTTS
jgi:hypothetical protein